jgi:hypothetical protein
MVRRGTPVVPDEVGWIVQCCATDATSASLREVDADGDSLHRVVGGLIAPSSVAPPTNKTQNRVKCLLYLITKTYGR